MDAIYQERDGPVAWVWLNRPERLNALNPAMLDHLDAALRQVGDDSRVRAVVVAARGRAFSAGLDLAWLSSMDAAGMRSAGEQAARAYAAVESCPQPVVVAVQGPAIGSGLLLAMAADFCLAGAGASFSAPEVFYSIFPALGLVPRLERRIGLAAARRMLLLGESLPAAEAQRLGLVEPVVPADALYAEASALAARLAVLPTLAVQRIKAAFAASQEPGYAAWEAEQVLACWSAPEREMALHRFLGGKA